MAVATASILIVPALAERDIIVDKSSDVPEEYYYQVLSNVKDYGLTFPDYVQSVSLTQNALGNSAEIVTSGKAMGMDIQMAYYSDEKAGTFSADVINGQFSGTTLATALSKTWSFDSKNPTGATLVHAELKLHYGFFSLAGLASDEQIKSGLEQAIDKIGERAKVLQQSSGGSQLVTTPPQSTTQPITPVTTPPPLTTTIPKPTPTPTPIPVPQPIQKPPISTPPQPTSITPTPPPQQTQTQPTVTVKTDLSSYKTGDTIIISGSVQPIVVGTPLTIKILDPNGNLVVIHQDVISQDGMYTDTVTAVGGLWKSSGTYTVIAQYGSVITQTTFSFSYSTLNSNTASSGYYPIKNGLTFAVGYTIKGASLSSMSLIPQTYSLKIFINSQSDGAIEVTIPTGLLDAKIPPPPNTQVAKDDLQDTSFIVVINGKQVAISETKISGARTLSIPFHNGDTEITIVGTWVL